MWRRGLKCWHEIYIFGVVHREYSNVIPNECWPIISTLHLTLSTMEMNVGEVLDLEVQGQERCALASS